jgi:hypothetical protein
MALLYLLVAVWIQVRNLPMINALGVSMDREEPKVFFGSSRSIESPIQSHPNTVPVLLMLIGQLLVYDLTISTQPKLLTSLPGWFSNMIYKDNILYATSNTIQAWNFTIPTKPILMWENNSINVIGDMAITCNTGM